MPELPEIECLRRGLEPLLVGAAVQRVHVRRADVVQCNGGAASARRLNHGLLRGGRIRALARHGKQLAIACNDGRVICIHLGMSGQLRFAGGNSGDRTHHSANDHVHIRWRLACTGNSDRNGSGGWLLFRDSRRFGGVWTYPSVHALQEDRWSRLGPDALTITARQLGRGLSRTRRAIKSALLDQAVLAGVGNIYADEALFDAGIDPRTPACALAGQHVAALAASIRRTLRAAIRAGGSTLRDYVNAAGEPGWFARRHRVYGRCGEPCFTCSGPLDGFRLSQRMTVACSLCQRLLSQAGPG